MYVCIHHIYIYMYTHMYLYIHVCIYIYMCVCIYYCKSQCPKCTLAAEYASGSSKNQKKGSLRLNAPKDAFKTPSAHRMEHPRNSFKRSSKKPKKVVEVEHLARLKGAIDAPPKEDCTRCQQRKSLGYLSHSMLTMGSSPMWTQ